MANSKVNILGTNYEIVVKKYGDDEAFERRSIDGYCDHLLKQIVICGMTTYKGWENEPVETAKEAQKQTQFRTGKTREVQRFLYNVRPRRIGAKEKENE